MHATESPLTPHAPAEHEAILDLSALSSPELPQEVFVAQRILKSAAAALSTGDTRLAIEPETLLQLADQLKALEGTVRSIRERAPVPLWTPMPDPAGGTVDGGTVISQPRAPEPIGHDEILVIRKLTKVEHDCHMLGVSQDEMIAKYRQDGADVAKILGSHHRQMRVFAEAEAEFGVEKVLRWNEDPQKLADAINHSKLIVALGGDNHLQWISQFVTDKHAVIGINSDPGTSTGALLTGYFPEFRAHLHDLEDGRYILEPWTRIEVRKNGNVLPLCSSEVFIGERERRFSSRDRIAQAINEVEHAAESTPETRSSGLLIFTGAGSTGWALNACQSLPKRDIIFDRTDEKLRLFHTESFRGSGSLDDLREAHGHTTFTVESINGKEGLLVIDGFHEIPFERGARATIRISPTPLWTVRFGDSTGAGLDDVTVH